MNKTQIVRRVMSLPFLGGFVKKKILESYDPSKKFVGLEATGQYGERFYYESLAQTRNGKDWMFKVYTSQKALDDYGIVTTIAIDRYYDRFYSETNTDRIKKDFLRAIQLYERMMRENVSREQWEAIANGRDFTINATGKIALVDGTEMSIKRYMEAEGQKWA